MDKHGRPIIYKLDEICRFE